MHSTTLHSLFDELEKISGDLIEPAVVANSDAVSGPPATPFARRRGYRNLEKSLEKDAGLGEDLRKWREKANNKLLRASIKVHQKLPTQVQSVVNNPAITDPSDFRGGMAIQGLKRIIGG